MDENTKDRSIDQVKKSKRNFLVVGGRNLLAIGAVAAAAVAARVKPAAASTVCFLKGTRIQTESGERKVEELAVGDLLPTVFGGMRPIQWIGTYRYKRSDSDKPWMRDVRPIRVAHSALAPDVPHTDLFLTQFHALFVDDVLVPVGSLINGSTIARWAADDVDELEYFHIKLETHDVIFAEGAPCESLLIVDETSNNFADYYRRHGMSETDGQPCAPLLSYDGGRGEMKSRIRSALSPLIDRRQKLDLIRDRLEERAIARRQKVDALS